MLWISFASSHNIQKSKKTYQKWIKKLYNKSGYPIYKNRFNFRIFEIFIFILDLTNLSVYKPWQFMYTVQCTGRKNRNQRCFLQI